MPTIILKSLTVAASLSMGILSLNCSNVKISNPPQVFNQSFSPHLNDSNLTQQLLSVTNDIRVRLVWLQSQLISDDTTSYVENVENYLFNFPGSQLVIFDTDSGAGRVLDSSFTSRGTPLISRDGSQVLWSDLEQQALYKINWDGTGRKILLQGNFYLIVCTQWDDVSKTEWLYVSNLTSFGNHMPEGDTIYRYPFDGENLDAGKRELMSSKAYTTPWTVSGDGKYAGGDIDWPKACIEPLPDGTTYVLGDSTVANCHSQIAPDTSYLFFNLMFDHSNAHLYRFTTFLHVTSLINMPGNAKSWDCCCPRWTNNTQYLTGGYPYVTAYFYNPPLPAPKTLAPGASGEFCFGKFNQDLTAITWVRITDMDKRFRKLVGDGWVANGEGPNKS
jgi:hypothetical protein